MGYSGANEARRARESLGKTLEALQQEEDVPEPVLEIAEHVAQSISALFEAEQASTELDGKGSVKSALGTLSQTLALLQDVKSEHGAVLAATEGIAAVTSMLFPLTNRPSARPEGSERPTSSGPPASSPARMPQGFRPSSRPAPSAPPSPPPSKPLAVPPVSPAASGYPRAVRKISSRPVSAAPSSRPPTGARSDRPGEPLRLTESKLSSAPARASGAQAIPTSMLPPPAPVPVGERRRVEANLGATTQSNFYVGFSGEIAHGGVFLATYEALSKDTSVSMLVTLPGGFEFECEGYVRFVRDPMDFSSESEPGMGIQFESLSDEARELALRFVRQRAPMFYDV